MNLLKLKSLIVLASILFPLFADAAVTLKPVEYKDGDTILEGYVAFDPALKGKRPGVLVVHEWNGLGSYVKMRIEKLAQLGFVAFAADIYGKGVRPSNPKDAGDTAKIYKSNRPLLRKRVNLALEELKRQPGVDTKKLAAMGYCFGGTSTLELARSGADLKGFISFHGGLDSPTPQDAKNIKAPLLILHGADDPFVPSKDLDAFEKEMNDAHVNWELIKFSGAVHGFTNPENGTDNSKGAAYNKIADQKSWDEMKLFFAQIFQ